MHRSSITLRKNIFYLNQSWKAANQKCFSLGAAHHLRSSAAPSRSPVTMEPFLNGSSSIYIEKMYESWQQDRHSVHKSWDVFFTNVESGAAPGKAFQVIFKYKFFILYQYFLVSTGYFSCCT